MKCFALFATLILIVPVICVATTIHVPGDQPTIQAGIDAAATGDSVIVACGTYFEHDISITTGMTLRGETGDPGCVMIDGESQSTLITCMGVSSVKVQGISFFGGGGPGVNDGGGMHIDNSDVEIKDCRFMDNVAAQKGGAVFLSGTGSISLTDCTFEGNHSEYLGGGIAIDTSTSASVLLIGCSFNENTAYNDGGGAWVSIPASVTFGQCTFDRNRADFIYIFQSHGGAISIEGSATLFACEFLTNSSYLGGALHVYRASSPPSAAIDIDQCVFQSNQAIGATTGGGGAIRLHRAECTISNSTFSQNTSSVFGSSIEATYYSTCAISSSIFAFGDNIPIRCNGNSWVTCECTNIFGNTNGDWVNCIGNQAGQLGNISEDPLFCDFLAGDLEVVPILWTVWRRV